MTRHLIVVATLIAMPASAFGQVPEPPIADTRLTVHTLVREDIFAGFLQSDIQCTGIIPAVRAHAGNLLERKLIRADEVFTPDFGSIHFRCCT